MLAGLQARATAWAAAGECLKCYAFRPWADMTAFAVACGALTCLP